MKWSRRRTRTHTPHTHTHTSVPAIAKLTAQLVLIKINTVSEPNISAPTSVSPLERDWRTKPIIYIINNSLAFRYVIIANRNYYGIFGFVPNERGRIHEHKAPFRKQLSSQAFKVYSFVSLCERTHSESAHGHSLGCFVFKCGNSRHSLFFCWRLSNSVALLWAPPYGLGVNCLYSL